MGSGFLALRELLDKTLRRVSVVGTSGAGKSTFAAALAGILGAPWLELDSVYHQPGWEPLPAAEYRARVAAAALGESWVIDGNYSTVRDIVWARADTVIFLDLPRRTVMRRVIVRTVRRVAGRVELWNGNRERWRNFFTLDGQESVIAWAWQTHARNRSRYTAAAADPAFGHLRFVRLTSSRAVRQFLHETSRSPAYRGGSGFRGGSGGDRSALNPPLSPDPPRKCDWWGW